jgi:hypothetical protein
MQCLRTEDDSSNILEALLSDDLTNTGAGRHSYLLRKPS